MLSGFCEPLYGRVTLLHNGRTSERGSKFVSQCSDIWQEYAQNSICAISPCVCVCVRDMSKELALPGAVMPLPPMIPIHFQLMIV